jgi:hypothetical protein
MSNIPDFLWATTDVAIWSTIEIGIGITASSAATLRPLFRVLLGASRNASGKGSQMWGHGPSDRPSGYIRNRGTDDAVVLRSDIGKGGFSTRIHGGTRSGDDGESLERVVESGDNDSVEKLRGDDSDEWDRGIIKTTKTTQVRE